MDRSLETFSRRRADAGVVGAGAGRRSRPAAARRAHQPSRHRVAGVARDAPAALDAAVVLVAHDRWFLEAVGTSVLELEGGRSKFFKGTWYAWRAEKAQRELALGRAIEKQQAEIAKLQRFVDRFSAGTRSRQASSRAKKLEKIGQLTTDPKDSKGLGFAFKPPRALGPGRVRARGREAEDRRPRAARRRRAVARALRARVPGGRERHRQDDAHHRADRPARARRRQAAARAQRQARAAGPARRGVPAGAHGARGVPARHQAHAQRGAVAARQVPVQRRGRREAVGRAVRRRAPAALAGDPRAAAAPTS